MTVMLSFAADTLSLLILFRLFFLSLDIAQSDWLIKSLHITWLVAFDISGMVRDFPLKLWGFTQRAWVRFWNQVINIDHSLLLRQPRFRRVLR